ncbi:hypothetical protein AB0756_39840, partial [Tolypothrix campylonemoides VB511288_2]
PYSSPLSYLRLVDWINLAQRNTSLGKLKIIINTPTKFLIELKTQDLSEASPILRENLDWLFQIGNSSINQISLNLNNYSFKDIAKIVSNISSSLGCKWSNDSEICELFAQIVEQSCNSFDTLRLFCLESRDLEVNDKKLLDLAERYLERSLELFQEIQDLDSNIKVFLIAVIIGEIFVQLSKDYMYYSKISFDELCQYLGITNLLLEQSKSQNLLYWLNFDLNNNLDTQSFPRFRHPDIRAAFDIWSLSENGKKMISEIISSSVFLKVFTNSKITAIMRWESIYLLCRLGHFLNNEICEYVDEKWFRLSKTAFDYRNTLWAITDNFIYIKDSLFEKYAVAALKRIQNEEHSLRRNFIWEIMNNWSYMNEEIRYFVLKLNCQENRKDEKIILKPQMSEHHFIAFLGASLCNYRTINKLANDNKSQASKDCLDFINTFVSELSKSNNIDKAQYKGHEDDGIFNDRGAMYPGREVLQRVRKIGLEYGGLEENLQIVKNIDAALS